MSALGQKQTSARVRVMSALPPKADIAERDCHVCFGPKADIEKPIAEATTCSYDVAAPRGKTLRLAYPTICRKFWFAN
jgi:hypothetical protein